MFSTTLVALFTFSLLSGVRADQSLSLKLSGPNEVQDVDKFAVVATLTNTGSETVRLYKNPQSALHDFPEDTFKVTGADGETPEFIGAYAKWTYKAADDIVTLAPGESHKVTHQLGEAYNFTKTGTYSITPDATFYVLPEGRNPYPVPIVASLGEGKYTANLSGNLVSTIVAKRIAENEEFLQESSLQKAMTFNGCSASQKSALVTAAADSLVYTANAISKLTSSPNTARYRKWFGAYNLSNRNTVLNHYKLIQSGDPRNYRYDCTCTLSGVYAFVNSGVFGTVHLCPVFWTAPALGTDSKAGTIVHESSHFTRNGGTKDHKYGQTACAALAISDPAKAIMNADSHEYFAENTPALS